MELYCTVIVVKKTDGSISAIAITNVAVDERVAKGMAIADVLDMWPQSETIGAQTHAVPRALMRKVLGLPDAED